MSVWDDPGMIAFVSRTTSRSMTRSCILTSPGRRNGSLQECCRHRGSQPPRVHACTCDELREGHVTTCVAFEAFTVDIRGLNYTQRCFRVLRCDPTRLASVDPSSGSSWSKISGFQPTYTSRSFDDGDTSTTRNPATRVYIFEMRIMYKAICATTRIRCILYKILSVNAPHYLDRRTFSSVVQRLLKNDLGNYDIYR